MGLFKCNMKTKRDGTNAYNVQIRRKNTIHVLILITFNTYLLSAQAQHFSFNSTFEQNNQFIEQHNRNFSTVFPPIARFRDLANYSYCIKQCFSNDECQWINVYMRPKKKYECLLYEKVDGEFTEMNAIFISKRELQCSNYCEELSYLEVCGPCKCVSMCLSLFPFYCDCAEARSEQLMNCVTPIVTDEGSIAALYNMQSRSSFKAMCQENHDISDDGFWMTVLRRYPGDYKMTGLDFLNVIGQPYGNIYFIGYHHLYYFTIMQGTAQTLRIDLVTKNGLYFWIELDNFKSMRVSEAPTFSKFRDFCCVNINPVTPLNKLIETLIFKRKSLRENYRVYSRITIMMRPGRSINRYEDPGFVIKKKGILGYVSTFEYCISFEYLLTSSETDIHSLFKTLYIDTSYLRDNQNFCYIFHYHMLKWVCRSMPQPLQTWLRVSISKFKNNRLWYYALHFNHELMVKERIHRWPATRDTPVMTANRDSNPTVLPCRMRNVYVDGVKIA